MNYFESFTYDANDNLIGYTDKNNHTQEFIFNQLDQITGHKDALNHLTQFAYDHNGNLTSITDANGHPTQYTYNGRNQNTIITYANATTEQFWYNGNGKIIKKKDNNNNEITFDYNLNNQLITRHYPDNTQDAYTYDAIGRLVSAINQNATVNFTYDNADRMLTETLNGLATSYNYDIPNRNMTIIYPAGRTIIEKTDFRNRLVQISENGAQVVGFSYDISNRLIYREYANGASSQFTYNANDWMTHYSDFPAISDIDMAYDQVGNMLYRKDNLIPDRSETYAYDDIDRLTGFKHGIMNNGVIGNPVNSIIYGMDALGNRTTVVEDGITTNYTANNLNQYTTITGGINANPVYDANGNMLSDHQHSYSYDFNNHMIGVDNYNTGRYSYDALMRRIEKITSTDTTHFYYTGERIIEERDGGNNIESSYLYGNWIDDILSMSKNGQNYFYHKNHLGSVIALTNTSGNLFESYTYKPYGKTSFYDAGQNPLPNSAINNSYLFTGRSLEDESGLYYYRARHLNNDFGRFSQRDPLEFFDSFDLYQYSDNNPINYIDPSGTSIIETLACYGKNALDDYAKTCFDESAPWYLRVPACIGIGLSALCSTPESCLSTINVLSTFWGVGVWEGRPFWRYVGEKSSKDLTYLTRGYGWKSPFGKNWSLAKDRLALPNMPNRVIEVRPPWWKYVAGPERIPRHPGWGEGGGTQYYYGRNFPK